MKHIIPYMLPNPGAPWYWIEVDDSEVGEGETWQDVARRKWAALTEKKITLPSEFRA